MNDSKQVAILINQSCINWNVVEFELKKKRENERNATIYFRVNNNVPWFENKSVRKKAAVYNKNTCFSLFLYSPEQYKIINLFLRVKKIKNKAITTTTATTV